MECSEIGLDARLLHGWKIAEEVVTGSRASVVPASMMLPRFDGTHLTDSILLPVFLFCLGGVVKKVLASMSFWE